MPSSFRSSHRLALPLASFHCIHGADYHIHLELFFAQNTSTTLQYHDLFKLEAPIGGGSYAGDKGYNKVCITIKLQLLQNTPKIPTV